MRLLLVLLIVPLVAASHVPAPDVPPRQPTFGSYWEDYRFEAGVFTAHVGHKESGAHALHLRQQADDDGDGQISETEANRVQQVLMDASGVRELVQQQRRIKANDASILGMARARFELEGFVGATERSDELAWSDTWTGSYTVQHGLAVDVSGKSPQVNRNLTIRLNAPGFRVTQADGLPTHEMPSGSEVAWDDVAGTWYAGPPWQARLTFERHAHPAPALEGIFFIALLVAVALHGRPRIG